MTQETCEQLACQIGVNAVNYEPSTGYCNPKKCEPDNVVISSYHGEKQRILIRI